MEFNTAQRVTSSPCTFVLLFSLVQEGTIEEQILTRTTATGRNISCLAQH